MNEVREIIENHGQGRNFSEKLSWVAAEAGMGISTLWHYCSGDKPRRSYLMALRAALDIEEAENGS